MKRFCAVYIAVLLILCSCATNSNSAKFDYFQMFGREGQTVFTTVSENKRISAQIYEDGSLDAIVSGVPSFYIKTAMRENGNFTKVKNKITYYKDNLSSLKIAFINDKNFIITEGDIEKLYLSIVSKKNPVITGSIAQNMRECALSVFFPNSKLISSYTNALDKVNLSDIKYILLCSADKSVFNADFMLYSEKKASSFLTIAKSVVLSAIKRQGLKPDIKLLSDDFTTENCLVKVKNIRTDYFTDFGFIDKLNDIWSIYGI